MRKFLTLLTLVVFMAFSGYSAVTGYSWSMSNGTYTPITGATTLGTGTVDDTSYPGLPIGFTFTYDGTAYTQFSVNANGFMAMGATISSSYSPISSGTSNNIVAAFGRDLQGNAGGLISYVTTGTAPNRVLTVEWKDYRAYAASGASYNFQIKLSETTNKVEIVYGSFTNNATTYTPQVGIRGASNADYANRTTTTNWSATTAGAANNATMTLTSTVFPVSGLTYTYQIVAPNNVVIGTPANGATGVVPTATLNWTPGTGGGPSGYKVYFGTDNPPTNLENGTVVTSPTYDPFGAGNMALNTTYYWSIIPYNGAGQPATAPVWSFTTLAGYGSLVGYVYDCLNAPVAGATVGVQPANAPTQVTGADGKFQFLNIPATTYTLAATKVGYNTVAVPGVIIDPNLVTNQNVILTQPTMAVTPNPYNVSVSPNELLTGALTVANQGCGPLTWTATVAYGSANHTWLTMPTLTGTVPSTATGSVPAFFNATGLAAGTVLSATVTFTPNPAISTALNVPVTMIVGGATLVPVTNLAGSITNQLTGATTLTWDCTPSAGFLYYTVKRNGVQVAVVPTATTYSEVVPAYGVYNYCVDAIYTEGATAAECVSVEWSNPTMTWTPAALANTQFTGTSANVPMTIGNTGLGTLSYTFPDWVDNSGDAPMAYCTATATACDEFIGNVAIGTINKASACNNYSNFTTTSTDLVKGVTVPMTVLNGGNAYGTDYVYVWIDYNHNDTFDASELTQLATNGGGSNFTGNIAVPASAMTGNTTMRVRMSYNTAANPCGSQTYGEVEDYNVNIKAPTFITNVAPAAAFVGPGSSQMVNVEFSAIGDYAPVGVYVNQLVLNSNDLANPAVSIPCTMTVIQPAILSGVVTDGVTGAVLPGVMVSAGAYSAMTNDDGAYSFLAVAGTYSVSFSLIGYQTVTASATVTAGNTTTLNAQLFEMPYAPSCASASVDAGDTQATVTWCVPTGPYELLYDDGSAENYAAWQVPGNLNAVKFTPKGYPAKVVGGKFYVGDGSFPAGGNFMGKQFRAEVYKADGTNGLPGTFVDSTTVTVNSFGWVTVNGLNATIASGDFYLAMVQLSLSPNCVPIGVDVTVPKAYKSYSRNVGTGSAWVLSPYQDFMMHAIVSSPMSGDDDAMVVENAVPAKVAGMISMVAPDATAGKTGMAAMVTAPEGYDNMDNVSKYSLSRIFLTAVNPVPPASGTFTLINNALTATTYNDGGTTWSALAQGWYAYGVKAVYPNGNESAFVYTNNVPHKMFADVTVNVKLVCGFVPAVGAEVTFVGQNYPNNTYTATVNAAGAVFFDNMIKGMYDMTIIKAGYTTYTQQVNVNGNKTLNIILDDIKYMPRNLAVDCGTLVATWEEPLAFAVQENFEGGVFPPAGWQATTQGSVGWYATTDGGSAYFPIPGHTTYAVTNDDEGGSSNVGCCDYLITPELDLTGAPSFVLSFQSYYDGGFGHMAFVEMSTDAGATWTPIYTCSPSTSWEQVDVDLSAYSGAAGLSSVWFQFHSDDGGAWAAGWAIDDVTIASGGVPVQGYGVFLDGTEVGQTQELTWTFNPATITYGQTYVAGVAGLYCSGYSDLETYTFTSCFLYPPRNLQAQANLSTTSGAVILTWQEPLGGDYAVSGSAPRTGIMNPNMEYSPNVTLHTGSSNTDAMWDVLFVYSSTTVSQAGVETDGNFIYTSVWNAGTFVKYALDGTFVETFTVAGASNIRDLAYDGTFFYGSDATASLKKMDFTNKVLVGTIATGASAGIRHIGYDPNLDGGNGGFWCGNWSNLATIKMDGSLIQNVGSFNLAGTYGTAVDPENNKVWFHDQGGNGCDLVEFDAATLAFTGVVHDATTIPGFLGGSIAGGLAYTNLVVPGKWVLMGLIQQGPTLVFGYEMSAAVAPVNSNLLGYHIYRDDASLVEVGTDPLTYWDLDLMPATYCYDITAVYDLEPYGFLPGTKGESIKEGTACANVWFGYDLPFTEDWTTGQFDVNQWTVGPNWVMDGQAGNALPSAKFKWDPLLTAYSSSLESFYMNGAAITTTTPYKIMLDFDLKLDDRTASTMEKLTVEVWNGSTWASVKEIVNNGDMNWDTVSVDISNKAKNKVFKVRFNANGDLSGDIFYWAIDNIHIYVQYVANPPLNLVATSEGSPKNDIKLTWGAPAGGGTIMTFILDDGSAENGWGINPAAEAWLGNEFAVTETGVLQSLDLYWMMNASAGNDLVTVDIFDASQTIVGTTAPFAPVDDAWQTVALDDIPFAGTFYAMVHWNNFAAATNYLGSDEDGPNAAANYGWYYDGAAWAHLSDFGYAPCVFTIRAKALVGGDHMDIPTYGAASTSVSSASTLLAVKADKSANTGDHSLSSAVAVGDNSEGLLGYNVYRRAYAKFPAGQNTAAAGTWTMINPAVVPDLFYTDMNLSNMVTNCYEYYVTALYDEVESEGSNIDWECIFVGVDPNETNSVSVYPNPATNYVRIDLTKSVTSISIYNSLGSVVAEKSVKGETSFTINTTNYAAGAYSVKFTTTNGENFNRKFVVTK